MKLSDHFAVPSNVGGYLEWASGILFVNATHAQFQASRKAHVGKLTGPEMRMLQTVTHETYHFLQIVTTGYLYQFACCLFEAIKEIVKPPVSQARLEELLADPPPPSERLLWLAEELDAPGPEGVTVRSIVESAAFLYEHKMRHLGLTASGYTQFLDGVKT